MMQCSKCNHCRIYEFGDSSTLYECPKIRDRLVFDIMSDDADSYVEYVEVLPDFHCAYFEPNESYIPRVCENCKYIECTTDDYDSNSETGRGHRMACWCTKRTVYKPIMTTFVDASCVPNTLTVVERSCAPDMSKDDCYLQKFGCNFFEYRQE